MNVLIRIEEEGDHSRVEELARESFWNLYRPGCDEHYVVHTMRAHPDFIKDLDYVAEIEGIIVGSIMYTKSHIFNENNEKIETATFGPLCVHPEFQRKGIGTRLIEYTKNLVQEKQYPAIIILGDPHNYCKHGFLNGKDYNVSTIDGKYPLGLLVLELQKGVFDNHRWRFKESNVYEIDQNNVDEYDKRFPVKEKKHTYTQDIFSILIRSFLE